MGPVVSSGAVLHILDGAIADRSRRAWIAKEADLPVQHGDWSVDILSRVWTLSLKETGRHALPIDIAANSTLDEWGLLSWVVRTAPTAREALIAGARCHRLITDRGTTSFEDQGDRWCIVWRSPEPSCEAEAAADLSTLSHFVQGVRELIAPIKVCEVSLRATAPRDRAPFERFFRAPIRFAQNENAFLIDPRSLDRVSPPQAHRPLFEHLMSQAEQRITPRHWLDELDDVLREQLEKQALDFREAARMLALSPRTLQRRLCEAGTSYRDRTDALRRKIALGRLSAGQSIGEVSHALGFSDPSAFSRAHKRWTGHTPARKKPL